MSAEWFDYVSCVSLRVAYGLGHKCFHVFDVAVKTVVDNNTAVFVTRYLVFRLLGLLRIDWPIKIFTECYVNVYCWLTHWIHCGLKAFFPHLTPTPQVPASMLLVRKSNDSVCSTWGEFREIFEYLKFRLWYALIYFSSVIVLWTFTS